MDFLPNSDGEAQLRGAIKRGIDGEVDGAAIPTPSAAIEDTDGMMRTALEMEIRRMSNRESLLTLENALLRAAADKKVNVQAAEQEVAMVFTLHAVLWKYILGSIAGHVIGGAAGMDPGLSGNVGGATAIVGGKLIDFRLANKELALGEAEVRRVEELLVVVGKQKEKLK